MAATRVGHIIGGSALDGADGAEVHEVRNPATGQTLGQVAMSSVEMADKAVEAAREAFGPWSETPVGDRVQVLFRYKQVLEDHLDGCADQCAILQQTGILRGRNPE